MLDPGQRDEFFKTLYNPQYVNPDHTGPIALIGIINGQKLLFYASPYDRMDYGREIYNKAIRGEYGEIGEYTASPDVIAPRTSSSNDSVPNPMFKVIEDLRKEIDELKSEVAQLKAQK
jgi:hypothetical protein